MTHEYEGHYRLKHGPNKRVDPTVGKLIRERASDGRLACASAFAIAEKTGCSPKQVGEAADLLEVRIHRCQLGLFGHEKGRRNIIEPWANVPEELEQALRKGVVDGRLPCAIAWRIAQQFDLPKMSITGACELLDLRIGHCQLGTF
jgi:hypothetical protein